MQRIILNPNPFELQGIDVKDGKITDTFPEGKCEHLLGRVVINPQLSKALDLRSQKTKRTYHTTYTIHAIFNDYAPH